MSQKNIHLRATKRRAQPPPASFDAIARIDALTRNARTTWFTLLGVCLFVGVTLMGVEHIDFYGVNRATQLPLVNVSVPTTLFFYAAPLLTAAVYIYFHLYLIRLFDELGAYVQSPHDKPLGQRITPWLVSDAALWLRNKHRKDNSAKSRPLEAASALFNFALAWAFGLIVLGFGWSSAWSARDLTMNFIGGGAFACAFLAGTFSYFALRRTALQLTGRRLKIVSQFSGAFITAVFLLTFALSYQRANPDSTWFASLDLSGEELVGKPDGWLPYQIARRDFLSTWRQREGLTEGELSKDDRARFDEEWSQRRDLALADLPRPAFDGKGSRILLKDAQLSRAFLADLNLRFAQMEGAVLSGAQMEGADLSGAQMEGADLSYSRLFGLTTQPSFLNDTNLSASINNGGALRFVDLTDAEFDAKTDFRNAFMDLTVKLPTAFRTILGGQCQSRLDDELNDADFYGRWRGWIEHATSPAKSAWEFIAPPGFENVTPIPPDDPNCEWKTDPMPGTK